jgi:hypothetical protein
MVIAGPVLESQGVNRYLLISMNFCTMWSEVSAVLHSYDELFLLLQDAKGTALQPRPELGAMTHAGCVVVPGILQDAHHSYVSTIGWHGRMLCDNSRGASEEGGFDSQWLPVWFSEGSYVCAVTCCFGLPPIESNPWPHVTDLGEPLHDVSNYAFQYLKVVRQLCWIPGRRESLLYCSTEISEKEPKLHTPLNVTTWINSVVCRTHCHPRVEVMLMH